VSAAMVDSAKVLCPLFDEIEILMPEHFPVSGQNVKCRSLFHH